MFDKCPGFDELRRPTIQIKKCPECGANVELFSDDVKVSCDRCGFIVYNDIESCVQWCKLAKDCVGEELYSTLMARNRKVE
jgi:ribosomal protein S27AE